VNKLKILFAHNAYQHRGGEDSVVEAEIALLRLHGHEVVTYFRSNDDIVTMHAASVVIQSLWSSRSTKELGELIRTFRPDVIHVHNTLPLISPSIYWAAARAGVPVVQTLHNFRLMCLNAFYLREGKVCEDCVGCLPWRGVMRKCYRGSGVASFVLALMLTLHRGLGTYRDKVTRYIALNDFCRNKFIEGGLPAELIAVKPNFVDVPVLQNMSRQGFLFVGRLSSEKGLESLAKAAALLQGAQLRVVGSGPQAALLDGVKGVTILGRMTSDAVLYEMSNSVAVVVPSIWYETFGMVVIEAFASGTPVIVSRIGVLAEIVTDGETGLLFEPGDAVDMASKMQWALNNPERMREMGLNARKLYEEKFSADQNYQRLIAIYREVIEEMKSGLTHDAI
jgi:glycosyltransferase involved in cell wall biosynthesis